MKRTIIYIFTALFSFSSYAEAAFVSVADPSQPDTSPITGIFAVPQNPPVPSGYIGKIADDDPRIAAFYAPKPADNSRAALVAGISIISTSAPSLNGTYGLDQISQNNVSATVTYILLNGTFPGGGTTMPWIDQSGVAHTWPNVAEFKAFATAYANYVAAVSLYAASNGAAGALPSNQVTIP